MVADTRLEAQVGALDEGSKGWTFGAAESCTGGLVMHRLTNVAGSSAYVLGGLVAYSNQVKQSQLQVRQGTLMAYGAVSEQVAEEMATGLRGAAACGCSNQRHRDCRAGGRYCGETSRVDVYRCGRAGRCAGGTAACMEW